MAAEVSRLVPKAMLFGATFAPHSTTVFRVLAAMVDLRLS
jgi:hypothetical protein